MQILIDVLWSCLMAFGLFWGGVILSILVRHWATDGPIDNKDPNILFGISITALKLVSLVAGVCLYIVLFK